MSIRSLFSALILVVGFAAVPAQALVISTFDGSQHGDIEIGLEVVDSPAVFSGVFEFSLSDLTPISFTAVANAPGVEVVVSLLTSASSTVAELVLGPGLAAGSLTLNLDAGSYSYAISSAAPAAVGSSLSIVSSVVPEPSVYAMLLSGLAVVGFAARRRRKDK